MTQLLNDDIYTKIMSSNDEEYIFETFIPLLPQISKCFVDNIDIFILIYNVIRLNINYLDIVGFYNLC